MDFFSKHVLDEIQVLERISHLCCIKEITLLGNCLQVPHEFGF